MGTNNVEIREDPLYIGLRRPRASLEEVRHSISQCADKQATRFMDKFMEAASTVFPSTVIQHEDFYSEAAFDFLERYQHKYRMFNDDIQG
jgi:malate dehydrogenase (oxaloacetate-decarboxylating)(NADP+)